MINNKHFRNKHLNIVTNDRLKKNKNLGSQLLLTYVILRVDFVLKVSLRPQH